MCETDNERGWFNTAEGLAEHELRRETHASE